MFMDSATLTFNLRQFANNVFLVFDIDMCYFTYLSTFFQDSRLKKSINVAAFANCVEHIMRDDILFYIEMVLYTLLY